VPLKIKLDYIYIYMVKANNYMFRPLTSHHQVIYPMKREVGGLYNILVIRQKLHCTLYSPNPFHWMYNLMMAC
jgi:hypothetical protein